MSRRERWEYPSLEWIHEIRARLERKRLRRTPSGATPVMSPEAQALVRKLHLRIVRPELVARRRRRSG